MLILNYETDHLLQLLIHNQKCWNNWKSILVVNGPRMILDQVLDFLNFVNNVHYIENTEEDD